MNPNPLNKYFRKSALYVSLPSAGRFYPDNTIDLTENNQYPVLPMTRQDEMRFVTATSQSNGSSVVSVIQSCIPNIKDAWKMPSIDIDKLLVAIKIVSHGPQLTIATTCTNCEHENTSTVDLKSVLDQITSPDYDQPVCIDDLEIYFQPVSYQQLNDSNLTQFDDEDIVSMLSDTTVDEQIKSAKVEELLDKVRKMATVAMSQNIQYIKIPDGQVSEQEYILDWLSNCGSQVYMQLQDHVVKNKQKAELNPAEITCSNCATQYQQVYNLNIANNE